MFIKEKSILLIIVAAMLACSCSGGKMEGKELEFDSILGVPEAQWKKLAEERVYFGHQSVGYNIIEGITDIIKKNPQVKLNIVQTDDPTKFGTPLFAHSPVGANGDPKSKVDEFVKFMDRGLGNQVALAFMKFCYVDFTASTDVEKVFQDYRKTFSALKEKYPKITFIHVTAPLTAPLSLKDRLKQIIKKIIGRPTASIEDNIKRSQFNNKMRKEYEGKEPLFDLARIESTYRDGTQALFEKDGKTYPHLVGAYTRDGGHLNEMGRKVVAEQLLVFLANLS
ncbi:MAG: SGNH/GDSL hydrolase family protein [Deltaproteobacteria bacterium]